MAPATNGIIAIGLASACEAIKPLPVVARVAAPLPAALPWFRPKIALTSPPAFDDPPDAPAPDPPAPVPLPLAPLPEPPEPEPPEPEPPEPEPPEPEPPEPEPTDPVVVVVALEPESEIAATPFEVGEASALELPTMAALVIW